MQKKVNKMTNYKKSGVDIDAGNKLVEKISPLAKSTARLGANAQLGGFGALFDLAACKYKDPILVASNDGVGTKLEIASITGIHDTIGIDLVAMCVNDLVVQGAEPLFFLDYFATGKLDNEIAEQVIKGIVDGCKMANCALIGGETAEMPGIYAPNIYDLAGFAVGAVERDKILPRKDIQEGDIIVGLMSSGIHSNGFSLVRHLITENKLDYHASSPFADGLTLGQSLLTPTKIYVKSCFDIMQSGLIKGLAHITGGGFTENIPRVLPKNLGVEIDCGTWDQLPVFAWLKELSGLPAEEMLRTFNCGIGMILITDEEEAFRLEGTVEDAHQIGIVTRAKNDKRITYINQKEFYAE